MSNKIIILENMTINQIDLVCPNGKNHRIKYDDIKVSKRSETDLNIEFTFICLACDFASRIVIN